MEDVSLDTPDMRDRLLARGRLFERVADELSDAAAAVAERAAAAVRDGGILLFCGNGGSAADAQHLAAEYVVRLGRDRGALPALALTTDTSVLTAAGNDYGFERVFARQIEALAGAEDLLFLHSTSGESENLLAAAAAARAKGVRTVALLARGGGRLRARVDDALVVPTDDTALAQEAHLALGHEICFRVEEILAGRLAESPDGAAARSTDGTR